MHHCDCEECVHGYAQTVLYSRYIHNKIESNNVILYTNQGNTIESSMVFIRELLQCDTIDTCTERVNTHQSHMNSNNVQCSLL